MLDVHLVALDTIRSLRPLLPRIASRDRDLARQLQRAASSVVLNVAEAQYSDAGNRRARFHTAAGSANETRSALELAAAWGHITPTQSQDAMLFLDRVCAMLWRLTRGR